MQSPRAIIAARWMTGLALLVVVIGWAVPAGAHTELVASTPALGAQVTSSTDRVVLEFGTELSSVGNDVVVRGPEGDQVTSGRARVADNTLQAEVALVSPGRHTVSYRFVGVDGHADTGLLWFTVVAEGAPPSATTAQLPVSRRASAQLDATSAAGSEARGPTLVWLLFLLSLVCLAYLAGGLLLAHHVFGARRPVRPGSEDGPQPWERDGS